jgi:enoyl-CoA hydratase
MKLRQRLKSSIGKSLTDAGARVKAMPVHTERRGEIAIVTIDRPEVRNAVDGPTADALVAAFESFARDDGVRVAILTGAGGTFCSGADLKAVATDPGRANRISDGSGPLGPTRMRLEKPTIAAVEAYAVAGGLELALWCDLRVAANDASFGVLNRRWGVPLMDGGTVRLPRLIGHGRALDLMMTGRTIGAEEAYAIGLVNRLVQPGEALHAALELAREIAAQPQVSLLGDRMSSYEAWGLDETEALANEHRRALRALESGESVEGAGRFEAGAGRHGGTAD